MNAQIRLRLENGFCSIKSFTVLLETAVQKGGNSRDNITPSIHFVIAQEPHALMNIDTWLRPLNVLPIVNSHRDFHQVGELWRKRDLICDAYAKRALVFVGAAAPPVHFLGSILPRQPTFSKTIEDGEKIMQERWVIVMKSLTALEQKHDNILSLRLLISACYRNFLLLHYVVSTLR